MGESEPMGPRYSHSGYKSQIGDGRINTKKCNVNNDPKGIFQHSNSNIKQKEINWSLIQIKPGKRIRAPKLAEFSSITVSLGANERCKTTTKILLY